MDSSTITQFYVESHRIATEAHFIISSLPNAELASVERITNQLDGIREILLHLDDSLAHPQEIEDLIDLVDTLLIPLDQFLSCPPPQPDTFIPRNSTGRRGRPSYVLDVSRAIELHALGNSWADIASVLGVDRKTLYNHVRASGVEGSRREHTEITDEDLDALVEEIARAHPFVGSTIIQGHLEARGVHIPRQRVQESLRRVDAVGVLVRWAGIIRRRVYKVRGSNALWHMDGNEKLRPWGFYVHGCIDGFSRLIIYLVCASNKRARTVCTLFDDAVNFFGWPSRVRGDFGTENNDVERRMKAHWGDVHNAFLRGRSIHNVRIERLWRDVRKDSLETFRQIFMHLEDIGLLDMEYKVHRVCLFLVFQPRIQASLDRTRDAWNHHKIRTERNRTPVALYELSREQALLRGYWTGDPGDPIADVQNDPTYGVDDQAPPPPPEETRNDPGSRAEQPPVGDTDAERGAGVVLNSDDELDLAREVMADFDFNREDGNWGIEVYIEAVSVYMSRIP